MNHEIDAVLEQAAERGRERQISYAGLVTPAEAWRLHQLGGAKIIDVRTEAEWLYVGHVPDTQRVEWRVFKATEPNPNFIDQLAQVATNDQSLMFLCRSAQRSHQAAMLATQRGYVRCYNILEGFEGDLDEHEQRGQRNGWRKSGLPWVQS